VADEGEVGSHKENAQQDTFRKPDEKLDLLGQPPKCPECGSTRVWKDGLRDPRGERAVQRWLCRDCGLRFSNPTARPNIPLHHSSSARRPRQSLNTPHSSTGRRQVCATLTVGAKNLAKVEARHERAQREGTRLTADVKSKIFNLAWWLKKQGRSEATIKDYTVMLRLLVEAGADLSDPESIKEVLARARKSNSWKIQATAAYTAFLKMQGKRWDLPSYKQTRKLPFIPTEAEIDALIASCGRKTSAFLQLLKETAMRSGEAGRLRWIDVDMERKILTLNEPGKGGTARMFRMSGKLASMLDGLPRYDERVFKNTSDSLRSSFFVSRMLAAKKLGNPRLKRITFHTFRHWKATMEYHKTKDLLYVKEFLGHRRVDNTILYIQLERTLFSVQSDEFHSAAAKTVEDARKLIEAGFEYVTEMDDLKIFRKPK